MGTKLILLDSLLQEIFTTKQKYNDVNYKVREFDATRTLLRFSTKSLITRLMFCAKTRDI